MKESNKSRKKRLELQQDLDVTEAVILEPNSGTVGKTNFRAVCDETNNSESCIECRPNYKVLITVLLVFIVIVLI